MAFKIVIAAPLEPDLQKPLLRLKNNPLLKNAEVHLVHVFHLQYYFNEFSLYTYPMDDQFPEIEKSVKLGLETLSKDLFQASNAPEKIVTNCFFHQDAKEKMVEYLNEVKADLVVVSTRGKHGLQGIFASSFAEHLNRFSPCDIYVLRPQQ